MEISVRTRDASASAELLRQVERSIEFAVDRHRNRVRSISVYLADLNGPKGGGDDKLCQITADVRGSRTVLILERGSELMIVVSRAARRLGYRVARSIHHRRIPDARNHRKTIRTA